MYKEPNQETIYYVQAYQKALADGNEYLQNKYINILLKQYDPLFHKCAQKLNIPPEIGYDDVISVARMSFVNVVKKYDPRISQLKTFSYISIMGEIMKLYRATGWSIKVPRRLKEAATSKEKDINVIKEKYGTSDEELEFLANALRKKVEYEEYYKNEGCHLIAEEAEEEKIIKNFMEFLNEEERNIFDLYFFHERSARDISDLLDIKISKVNKVIESGIIKLRKKFKYGEEDGE